MWPAIQHPFKGVVVAKLECAVAVVATEAGFVVDLVVGGELVNKVDGLIAGLAFGVGTCNCRHLLGMIPL